MGPVRKLLLLGFFFVFGGGAGAGAEVVLTSPSSLPVPVPSSATPSTSPSIAVSPRLDGAALLKEFQRAQYSALAALLHRQRKASAELKASEAIRKKEWKEHEKIERHKFLSTQPSGPDTRKYMRDYVERMKALDHAIDEEHRAMDRGNKARYEAEKADQATKLKAFKASLDRGEMPPANLWPDGGGK